MHHRTSAGSIRQSMCDIYFCISCQKSQHASSHIDRFDSKWRLSNKRGGVAHDRFDSSRCAISTFVSLAKKSQHASSHIDRFDQPSATSPLFFDNLHFGQIAKSVNLDWWLTFWAICPKWRLSKLRGLVADGCPKRRFWKTKQQVGRVFSSYLRWFVAQIEYSHPRKVHRKDTLNPLYCFPKSSHCSQTTLPKEYLVKLNQPSATHPRF